MTSLKKQLQLKLKGTGFHLPSGPSHEAYRKHLKTLVFCTNSEEILKCVQKYTADSVLNNKDEDSLDWSASNYARKWAAKV